MEEILYLPKGSFIVKVDEAISESGLFMGNNVESLDTGTIIDTHRDLKEYVGYRVKFRAKFGELVQMPDGIEYMFFRDFDSSIYYIMYDKK